MQGHTIPFLMIRMFQEHRGAVHRNVVDLAAMTDADFELLDQE